MKSIDSFAGLGRFLVVNGVACAPVPWAPGYCISEDGRIFSQWGGVFDGDGEFIRIEMGGQWHELKGYRAAESKGGHRMVCLIVNNERRNRRIDELAFECFECVRVAARFGRLDS